jgi:hypothetical protein
MSNWTTFYGWFYTQALRLCPRGFRADFGHENRLLMVAHTERGDLIRIISARELTPRERRQYEEADWNG